MSDYRIDSVYPWGRSIDEYTRMFSLTASDVSGRILDCGGGPASFCAELSNNNGRGVACDPLYQFTPDEIERRVHETHNEMVDLVRRDSHRFVWSEIESPEDLGKKRLSAMQGFIQDFRRPDSAQHYVNAKLPILPFSNNDFDLALVSHLLFLYSETMTEEFHIASMQELLRVAIEVRVFPLLDMQSRPSQHLQPVRDALQALGHETELRQVNYEFQKGASEMLVCRKPEQCAMEDQLRST